MLRFVYWYGFGDVGVGGGGGGERCARKFERRDGAEDGGISLIFLQEIRVIERKSYSTFYEEL